MIRSVIVILIVACHAASSMPSAEDSAASNAAPNEPIPETKVVGGVEASVGAYPFAAILSLGSTNFCGASVLNNKWIVTAGHCVENLTPYEKRRLRVTLGEHDLSVREGTEQAFTIETIILHPNYDSTWLNNDVALLKIKGSAIFGPRVNAITLPPTDLDFTRQNCTVIGWGATVEGGKMSNRLMQVAAPILDKAECTKKYSIDYRIQLCAGHTGGNQDSCQGDSGGALFCPYQGRLFIVGIVSFGNGCNDGGVYTKVSGFNSWIIPYLGQP